ncbi:unnamed protein product [Hyaloperonospora brassicae]|uniref:Sin1 middle CRIM domain-containing protein n=1 Tax=Hyaloperonospora brassicae TaxID=162125 RepID=A0AAV0UYD4_HYABA|nr:unnamed protein product [Hyaloperonospora brassicae]
MKVNVYIVAADGGDTRRICWYTGTSDAQVTMAIRMQLLLPHDTVFLLRDVDGDIVPVSSTLPNGYRYTLVLSEDLREEETAPVPDDMAKSSSDDRTVAVVNEDEPLPVIAPERATSASSTGPVLKKRRLDADESDASSVTPLQLEDRSLSMVAPAVRRESSVSLSMASIIAQFVDTFTQPIANDDNVSFIPNTGRFALYALYCEVVREAKFHPKREDVFYKMTSMHGKVDRQRVIRYYRCETEEGNRANVVQYKPQGKGVLLRRYRKTGSAEQLEDVVTSAPFIVWLQLDPKEVIALYGRFLDGFTPVVKGDYRAQSSGGEEVQDEGV